MKWILRSSEERSVAAGEEKAKERRRREPTVESVLVELDVENR